MTRYRPSVLFNVLVGLAIFTHSLSAAPGAHSAPASESRSRVETQFIRSSVLAENRIGLDLNRRVKTYLPPGYDDPTRSQQRYPVVYWFHGFFWDNERMFADGTIQERVDAAIQEGVIKDFILVAADFSSPTVGSFYENSVVSGRWLDFILSELVPFVDSRYRTLAHANSRALCGEMIGAYGALKLAMLHPDVFSMAYGLHPVATGIGHVPMSSRPDWAKVHSAKGFDDLRGDPYSMIFTAMAQAYSPNADRPPLYCDFIVDPKGTGFQFNPEKGQRLARAFLLDHMIADHAANLRKLRGFAFDWGRYDTNQDHVIANQNFTRKLEDLGVEHHAEEYRGNPWEKNWLPEGRVVCDVLPFFNRRLAFSP